MSRKHTYTAVTIFLCILLFTFSNIALAFYTSDLAGTWYGHQIVSGDVPADDPRWGYGTVVIDNSGNYTATWTSPTQTNEVSTGTVQINLNGIITIDNQPLTNGAMNDTKNQIVFIDGTPQSGGNALIILNKRTSATPFSVSDLEGTWHGHQIVSGDHPNDDLRWGYGTAIIDDFGNYTSTWTSPTQSNEVSSGSIQINGDGIVTIDNQSLNHGVINDAKDQIVFIDGTPQNQGNGLIILTRRAAGTNFGTSDLTGTWYGHQVVSGDAPNDDPRWGYGTVEIDDSGNYTSTWASPTQAGEVSSGSIQINAGGIITIDNQSLTHGVMNDAKDQFVFIDGTSQSGGNALLVFIRHTSQSLPGAYHMLLEDTAP